jgi:hypothetical protein
LKQRICWFFYYFLVGLGLRFFVNLVLFLDVPFPNQYFKRYCECTRWIGHFSLLCSQGVWPKAMESWWGKTFLVRARPYSRWAGIVFALLPTASQHLPLDSPLAEPWSKSGNVGRNSIAAGSREVGSGSGKA